MNKRTYLKAFKEYAIKTVQYYDPKRVIENYKEWGESNISMFTEWTMREDLTKKQRNFVHRENSKSPLFDLECDYCDEDPSPTTRAIDKEVIEILKRIWPNFKEEWESREG